MLALCIHAARDACIYANCVESHKALSKPGTPHFSPPPSPPALVQFSVEKSHSFGWWRGERYVTALETHREEEDEEEEEESRAFIVSRGNIDIRTSPGSSECVFLRRKHGSTLMQSKISEFFFFFFF